MTAFGANSSSVYTRSTAIMGMVGAVIVGTTVIKTTGVT
jgi:deoxycytidylate deaminase